MHDPIVVGHSISTGIAMIYAATFPVRGVVTVGDTLDVRPVGEFIERGAGTSRRELLRDLRHVPAIHGNRTHPQTHQIRRAPFPERGPSRRARLLGRTPPNRPKPDADAHRTREHQDPCARDNPRRKKLTERNATTTSNSYPPQNSSNGPTEATSPTSPNPTSSQHSSTTSSRTDTLIDRCEALGVRLLFPNTEAHDLPSLGGNLGGFNTLDSTLAAVVRAGLPVDPPRTRLRSLRLSRPGLTGVGRARFGLTRSSLSSQQVA